MYLSVKQVADRYSVSVPTIWGWVGSGPYSRPDFPRPYALSPQTRRWKINELLEWEAKRESAA